MLLRVHGLHVDIESRGDCFRGQALAEVELNERAILVREVREQPAHQASSFAHQSALARVRRARAQVFGLTESRAAGFSTRTAQEVVRGVTSEQTEPGAQLVAALGVEAAQLELVVGEQLYA